MILLFRSLYLIFDNNLQYWAWWKYMSLYNFSNIIIFAFTNYKSILFHRLYDLIFIFVVRL